MHALVRPLAWAAVFCVAALGSAACDAERGGGRALALPDSAVRVDLSTPDRALRTYWRLRDLSDTLKPPIDSSNASMRGWLRVEGGLRQVFGGVALRQIDNAAKIKERFSREIVEAKQETDSRAVVVARVRNVTPLPEGATLTDSEAEARREGEVFRYIFEREGQEWKLVQIQRNYATGGAEDWYNIFSEEPIVSARTVP
jgi:hypothetical protein